MPCFRHRGVAEMSRFLAALADKFAFWQRSRNGQLSRTQSSIFSAARACDWRRDAITLEPPIASIDSQAFMKTSPL